MRSFYGVDRLDNGYFISENFSESLIERDFLFSQAQLTPASLLSLSSSETKKVIKPKINSQTLPSSNISTLNLPLDTLISL